MLLSRCSSLGHGHSGSAEHRPASLAHIIASEVVAIQAYACRVQQKERGSHPANPLGHSVCFNGTAL